MLRLLAALVCVCVVLSPAPAYPCGGFFCSGGSGPPPVIQTGEKILFGFEAGEVTAHVQILYSGEPRAFAWVVPTPSLPKLSVGSDQLFTLLDRGTTPTFSAQFTNACAQPFSCGCGGGASFSGGGGFQDGGSGGGVNVISQAPVGPFDTAILSATDPKAMQKWLMANGFDVSAATDELLAPYVAKGDYFVALKLQSDKGVGDLQPIVLKYTSTEGPCVPIRLTAAAAQPDMGIAVFLLGAGRGVPINYLHLVLNEARINWQARGSNYPAVVTAAADEAGGRGFVTDFSGSSAPMLQTVRTAFGRYNRPLVAGTTPDEFVRGVIQTGLLGSSQNVLALMQRCVPVPTHASGTAIQFYQQWNPAATMQTTVDQPKCGDEFDALVVEPLRSAAAMMDRLPVLTRLYTTMSANEMTLDPIFVINPDMGEVASSRTLNAEMECNSNGQPTSATYTGTDGTRWTVPWSNQTIDDAPALLRAEQMTERGNPSITIDNTTRVKDFNRSTMGCGCMVAGGGSLVAIGIAMLVLVSRRRRFS